MDIIPGPAELPSATCHVWRQEMLCLVWSRTASKCGGIYPEVDVCASQGEEEGMFVACLIEEKWMGVKKYCI